ncbi:MAG: hypothetical protein RLZZ540_3054 [Bacteroidota bacterium]|jgi:Fic family protein
MASRGYYQAFQVDKESIKEILQGRNAGAQLDIDYGNGIGNCLKFPICPISVDAMRDVMPILFETEASVRAVLGHFIFVFIHPYMDGNGRMGRFLMNVMLVSGGYPWTVIPVERRDDYMQALEKASAEQDIVPFTNFLSELVSDRLQGKAVANLPDAG